MRVPRTVSLPFRRLRTTAFAALMIGSAATTAGGEQALTTPVQEAAPARSPLRSTQPIRTARTLLGYTYQEGAALEIPLTETFRIPAARGTARVERRRGATSIRVEVDGMKPATAFGGDFATYVFWTVSPEGQVENTGEFVLRDRRAQLEVSTPLQTFGMMVTAEPHLLVRRPSSFVVLQNQARQGTTLFITQPVILEYRGFEGIYSYEDETLREVPYARGDLRTDAAQARLAISLAERAGARTYAFDQLERARESFYRAVDAQETAQGARTVTTWAQEAIRLSLDAQIRSEELAYQAALDSERAEHRDELRAREDAIREARSETDRARLEIERREFELSLEREARDAARDAASLASRRAEAAEADMLRAARDREAALARMRDALGVVADARITARGLIVNLPDILFDFNVSALRPEVREVLSRLCGILSVTQGYSLEVEGHTDAIGTDEYNQALSENRARSVEAYMDSCALTGIAVSSKGLGESRPIATNDTAEGRSRNRRVEIIVQDTRR